MSTSQSEECIAFQNARCVARGPLKDVALEIKRTLDDLAIGSVLIFDSQTSRPVEVDLRGTSREILSRIEAGQADGESGHAVRKKGRGRPRLGVVSREVTLLPRHWAWLNEQNGGASVTLRKLVEQARRERSGQQRIRKAQDAAYAFMAAMAGNEPGFEEATRALYRGDPQLFEKQVANWPEDVRMHAQKLASPAFPELPTQ
jgi:hypothetical protein